MLLLLPEKENNCWDINNEVTSNEIVVRTLIP